MIEFPPGLCETKGNAMDVSAQHVRHQKRERCLESHRLSQQYQYYKDRQADCEWLPQTPRPLAYESKSGWEKAIFTWRTAMNIVHVIYSWMVICMCNGHVFFRHVTCTDPIPLQEKIYATKLKEKNLLWIQGVQTLRNCMLYAALWAAWLIGSTHTHTRVKKNVFCSIYMCKQNTHIECTNVPF